MTFGHTLVTETTKATSSWKKAIFPSTLILYSLALAGSVVWMERDLSEDRVKRSPSKAVPEREFVIVYSMSGQFRSDFSLEIFVIN